MAERHILTSMASIRRKLRNPPSFRTIKRQHDILPRHAGPDKFVGQAIFHAIPLDPDLAILDPHMHHDRISPPRPIPAVVDQQVLIGPFIKDRNTLDLSMTWRKFGMF